MKYYAVTEDPRELYHYGVKGMKWGQHIFGDKPKSPGYHKAVKKLKSIRKAAATGAKTAVKHVRNNLNQRSQDKYLKAVKKQQQQMKLIKEASKFDQVVDSKVKKVSRQPINNAEAKREAKYLKAVEKVQVRENLINERNRVDQENAYRKSLQREQKAERINERLANIKANRDLKNLRKSVKSEKNLDKYTQQAREGRLSYGKLSEDQIHKVQERLNLEEQARKLGGREKPSWRQQKKEARRQGKLQGITRATAAVSEEVARGLAQFGIQGLTNRIMMKSASKHEGEYERARNKAKNKKSARDIRKDEKQAIKEDFYREKYRDSESGTHLGKKLASLKDAKHERDRQQRLLDEANDERDKRYNKFLEEHGITDKDYRNQYSKLLEERSIIDPEAKQQKKIFDKLSENDQRAYLQRQNDEEYHRKNNENEIKRENEVYRIKLEQFKDDMTRYKNYKADYDKNERDYVKDYNEWLKKGAQGNPPRKKWMQPPQKPIPPVIPRVLLSSGNNGGGGKGGGKKK